MKFRQYTNTWCIRHYMASLLIMILLLLSRRYLTLHIVAWIWFANAGNKVKQLCFGSTRLLNLRIFQCSWRHFFHITCPNNILCWSSTRLLTAMSNSLLVLWVECGGFHSPPISNSPENWPIQMTIWVKMKTRVSRSFYRWHDGWGDQLDGKSESDATTTMCMVQGFINGLPSLVSSLLWWSESITSICSSSKHCSWFFQLGIKPWYIFWSWDS